MLAGLIHEKLNAQYSTSSYETQKKSIILWWLAIIAISVHLTLLMQQLNELIRYQNMYFLYYLLVTVSALVIHTSVALFVLKGKYERARAVFIAVMAIESILAFMLSTKAYFQFSINANREWFYLIIACFAFFKFNRTMIISATAIITANILIFNVAKSDISVAFYSTAFFCGSLGTLSILLFSNSQITNESITLAETELSKNQELNANLELKVIERTQRIKSIESSLKKYLPKQLVETITKGDQVAEPKTERRKLTVFFSDIKGFTDLTESMEAEDMSKLLNEYLTEMTTIAHKWGGTVDKFIGDAIMIFYGAPEETPDKDNALNCVKMAIEMQERMKELQKQWFHEGIENPLEIRIGISTGTATVGNFGAEDRLSYTVIGSQVNIASRLEGICEPNKIKISHPTWALISDEIECTPGEKVKVKGINREIVTYDVLS